MLERPVRLVVVVGPTASGKSALALSLAQALDGEVVSADAFAVYRGMDIGTAKPSAQALALVPHHLVSVFDPAERSDVQRWLTLAEAAIHGIRGRGRLPIIAGGTPLYVKLLLEGISAGPPRDEQVRERPAPPLPERRWRAVARGAGPARPGVRGAPPPPR